jgi:glycosidase
MEFHISRAARDRYDVSDSLFEVDGNAIFANPAASRKLANRMNEERGTDAANFVHPASLFAMGLIDELSHALFAYYRTTVDPKILTEALTWFAAGAGETQLRQLLTAFGDRFPNVAVYRGEQTAAEWLRGATAGMPHREAAMEELLLLWLANSNPAFKSFKELFDDQPLKQQTVYGNVTTQLGGYFETRPPIGPEAVSLLDALLAPMLSSPDSLEGQLAFIQENWQPFLGEELRRIIILAEDLLKEEKKSIATWLYFHPQTEEERRQRAIELASRGPATPHSEVPIYPRDGQQTSGSSAESAAAAEYERFSPDLEWMPTVVLIAKSTYVWLEQLSKKYGRHIERLDQIPNEELDVLASRGLNGLWLIGIWERSNASMTIKRLRGQSDAVASAYSLSDYSIAHDLGGDFAYRSLRDRAQARGIRLASDMVPNHMGIDSKWMLEHPEWFLSRDDSPYPAYKFDGPDLSNDSRIEIKIEDHYFEQTDAAVVFRYHDRQTGQTRYVYHGNDGTSFPWNDTAQLNYLSAQVREQVIQTIFAVARQFPIIRFDAAMTLAKKHVQRLWFPLPGTDGAIPSRAEASMTQDEFDSLMPHEFWREVVDRVAIEVPGTLLLAEAFWLLEGYFVRTLGMHRVYNSAFMNMMRDEENAKYRTVIKNTLEFDPDILKRYVNFMSNPDERTAIDQFGDGDKYFGVCTLMATLPGLPMFGHGQIEAFTEKYGMEYKRARYDEYPNEDLVARHQREIAPLLRQRRLFAESSDFVLYDFWNESGRVDENVFAYSNRSEDGRAIVIFNNHFGVTRGTIHRSTNYMNKATGMLQTKSVGQALHLPSDDAIFLAYQDTVTGLEYLTRSTTLNHHGFRIELRAYQYAVLQNWRELRPSNQHPWDRLYDALDGAGVYSLDEALSELRLRPVQIALRRLLELPVIESLVESVKITNARTENGKRLASVSVNPDNFLASFLQQAEVFFDEVLSTGSLPPSAATSRNAFRERCSARMRAAMRIPSLEREFVARWPSAARVIIPSHSPGSRAIAIWGPVAAWAVLGSLTPDNTVVLSIFDQLRLRTVLAEVCLSLGVEGEDRWRAAAGIRLLLSLAVTHKPKFDELLLCASRELWDDADVKWLLAINTSDGKSFFNKESFEEAVWWFQLPALMELLEANTLDRKVLTTMEAKLIEAHKLAAKAGYEVDAFFASLATGAPAEDPKPTPVPAPAAVAKAAPSPSPTPQLKPAPAKAEKAVTKKESNSPETKVP